MSKFRMAGVPLVLSVLGAYYAFIGWCIFFPSSIVANNLTGAGQEGKNIYGFWSGFGGTLLFSAAVLFPPWYYQHTCHYSYKCLRWGRYQAAGGTFKLCHVHHPDMQGIKPHHDMIHRLHEEWKNAETSSSS